MENFENQAPCSDSTIPDNLNPTEPSSLICHKSKKFIWILVFAVLFLLISSLIVFTAMNDPERIAEEYMQAVAEDNQKVLNKYLPYNAKEHEVFYSSAEDEAQFFRYKTESIGKEINNWNDYYSYLNKKGIKSLKNTYGEYTLTTKMIKSENYDAEKLRYVMETTIIENSSPRFDFDNVSEAKKVTVKQVIDGEKGTTVLKYAVYLIKYNGMWKVHSWDLVF